MAYDNNENKKVGVRKPRKRRAMGWVVATAVAATPALGCDDPAGSGQVDSGSQVEASASDAADTAAETAAEVAMETAPAADTGGLDADDDASNDAYADGIRG
jgi:hypothetical protein